jgi:hypothetical protein
MGVSFFRKVHTRVVRITSSLTSDIFVAHICPVREAIVSHMRPRIAKFVRKATRNR